MAWARDCGARTLAITNGAGSPLAEGADVAFLTLAGAERAVPATKTFTTQLAALAVLASAWARSLIPASCGPCRPRSRQCSGSRLTSMRWWTSWPVSMVSWYLVRGLAYSAALELALKLKEACYLHAMGLSYADLLHGPIAMVDAGTPAIIMAADAGPMLEGTVELAQQVTNRRWSSCLRHWWRRPACRGMRPRVATSAAARVARAARAHRARSAAHRGAVPPSRGRPGQPARPDQGHPDGLTGLHALRGCTR
jgi:hypothetical protein